MQDTVELYRTVLIGVLLYIPPPKEYIAIANKQSELGIPSYLVYYRDNYTE